MQLIAARHRQRGVSLIEALVTLFVLSIGLLGVAGLQSTGLQAGTTATQRSLAVFHSQEIIERMRANRAVVASYATATPVNNGCVDLAADAQAIVCTPLELVEDDLYHWNQSIQTAFPAGLSPSASITVSVAGTPIQMTVTISWTERQGTEREGTKRHVSSVFL